MTPVVVYQTAAVFVAGAVNSDVVASGIIAGAFMLMNTIVTYVLTRTRVDRREPEPRREPARHDDVPRRESDQ